MKRGWLASLLAAAVVLPMAARGADETKAPAPAPAAKAPNSGDTSPTKSVKGRLPPYYSKLPVDAAQREKIYEIQASFASKIAALQQQLDAIKAEESQQIRAVLTPEQQEKLKAIIAESKIKRRTGRATSVPAPKPVPTNKTTEPSSGASAPAPK